MSFESGEKIWKTFEGMERFHFIISTTGLSRH
jgi:hypothetical protein